MKLVALHGSTMNGAVMRGQLAALQAALPGIEVIAPDPHSSSCLHLRPARS